MIVVGVRWYLRYGLSYRDIEELLAERGIEVDHVTVYRWGGTGAEPAHLGEEQVVEGYGRRQAPPVQLREERRVDEGRHGARASSPIGRNV